MSTTDGDLKKKNLWDSPHVSVSKGHANRNTFSNNNDNNMNKKNEKSNLLHNEYKETVQFENFPNGNNNVSIYYDNEEDIIDSIMNDDDDIFGIRENTFSNKNLKTVNLSDMKRARENGIQDDRNSNVNENFNSTTSYNDHMENNKTNNSFNFSTLENVNNQMRNVETSVSLPFFYNQNVNGNRNSSIYHQKDFFEKEFNNTGEVTEMNSQNVPSGKMNIIDLNDNTNVDGIGFDMGMNNSRDMDDDGNGNNSSFDIFPFFKSMNSIRSKVLHYYNVDNDVIIYRLMCALIPYLKVDKRYDSMRSFDDIEKNVNELSVSKSYKENESALESEIDDENANIRKISNVNDAFDYYDNKLSIEKNPDIYGFVWLNIFISFTFFFIFNLKNLFFSDSPLSSGDDNISLSDSTLRSEEINKKIYISENKLNILNNTLIFLYLHNILTPLVIYVTNYFVMKKICPVKLSFLISLMSYNNVILFPIILIYKFTLIHTTISFICFLLNLLRFFIFVYYIVSSLFYIHKYTIRSFSNNFSDNVIYLNYSIFLFSYVFFYLLLYSYVFNYL
ncbi:hypothetical protein, conserved [Plasmodium gonderi]|uniref:Uncharacterized protein n=1 Tax=Plasmodium gonderi TaxID=77519 RepID=A0A1Y1JBB8_PLAGO|nr:hypothetical protein, conserved [Plasmodium gonderi]GAW79819.1 hypothetical protein, conserved [Plasmodium gonderi]